MIENKEELTLEERENVLFNEDDTNELPPTDIVSFNEVRSCADLLRLYNERQLIIQPDFQREVVWNTAAQTRFIDSLSKQLPIPSMCISWDYITDKRLVIDGLQRMTSIINFLGDDEFKLSKLEDVDPKISGKKVKEIKQVDPGLFSRIQNITIPVTVIRCDNSKDAHNEYLFTIFHRLNSGSARLNNQEIRNCIYSGNFNDLLKSIVNNDIWKTFVNFNEDKTYRFSHEEIILRVFAFLSQLETYNGKLARFLNKYMNDNRNITDEELTSKRELITDTITLIKDKMLSGNHLPTIPKTTLEGLLYGVAKNVSSLKNLSGDILREMYENFHALPNFSNESLKGGLSGTEKVKERLQASENCFKIND